MALIRLRRQLSVATRWASWISMAPSGARLLMRAWENWLWAARSSSVIVVTWPVRPWRRAFIRERLRPSFVFGPVDRRALLRLGCRCFSEIMTYLPYLFVLRRGRKTNLGGWRGEGGNRAIILEGLGMREAGENCR